MTQDPLKGGWVRLDERQLYLRARQTARWNTINTVCSGCVRPMN